ncbi:Nucleolar protein 58 [Tulasnella sp. JGI-2019a]|nr:Nucleolar protein 58 [Tulasnella sp. JGI-2019a]KAG9017332.1 Nucleolar protein 58 [Tulasnella sp. JGI-2019a]
MVLVLYETSLGFCLFKLTDEGKLNSENLWKDFETPEGANSLLRLKALHRFGSTVTAVEEMTAMTDGKLGTGLKKFLTDEVVGKGKGKESLVVVDPKLATAISKKLSIKVISENSTMDLYRGIRSQLASLLDGLDPKDLSTMNLGLSHSLSRFKVKFSPDKVDTMIVQAIGLLDELDKEINIYSMRVKEWYGWHFPEMGKIIVDNLAYAKCVRAMGFRTNASSTSFAYILPEELEATLKVAAEISMGTEIADTDINHIHQLCDQVIAITEYRAQLYEYLKNRMAAVAPNLTALVGELVGARLIAHAGSLLSLAKAPASTIQILGAEKALFRALKSKHDTPKYGLIFHASLVGQAPQKLKGKMARMVATKAALSIRLDALFQPDEKSAPEAPMIGVEARAKLESRLRALEYRSDLNGRGERSDPSLRKKQSKYEMQGDARTYNTAADSVDLIPAGRNPVEAAISIVAEVKAEKKSGAEQTKKDKATAKPAPSSDDESSEEEKETKEERKARKAAKKAAKAAKKAAKEAKGKGVANGDHDVEMSDAAVPSSSVPEKKKKRSRESEVVVASDSAMEVDADSSKKKKKEKKSRKSEA